MIQIPIEIGDIILIGRFKNKKVLVKEIGFDDYGNPTINGRSILKIRIPKLYEKENMNENVINAKIKKDNGKYNIYRIDDNGNEEETPLNKWPYETEQHATASAIYKGLNVVLPKPKEHKPVKNPEPERIKYNKPKEIDLGKEREIKLENLIRKIYKEEVKKLSELEYDDESEMGRKVHEYAKLSDEIDLLKSQLKALESKFAPLDDEFVSIIDSMDETKERVIKTKTILVTIKKKGYEAKSPKYKEAFELLYSKVNAKMKKLAEECRLAVETTKKVSSSLAVQKINPKESVIKEGLLDKIKSSFTNLLNKIKNIFPILDSDISKLERLSKM